MNTDAEVEENDDCPVSEKVALAALDALLACEEAIADGAGLGCCQTCQNIQSLHHLLVVGCLNFIGDHEELDEASPEIAKRLQLWDDFNQVANKRRDEMARMPSTLPDEIKDED